MFKYTYLSLYIFLHQQGSNSKAQSAAVTHTGDWAFGVPDCSPGRCDTQRPGTSGFQTVSLKSYVGSGPVFGVTESYSRSYIYMHIHIYIYMYSCSRVSPCQFQGAGPDCWLHD